jgi:hypothetical protein
VEFELELIEQGLESKATRPTAPVVRTEAPSDIATAIETLAREAALVG